MHYDVAIVGAGLVGASLALALKSTGLQVALIEALPPNPSDKRLFALHMSSVQFLKHIQVWPLIAPHASPIKRVHISKQKCFGVVQLNSEEMELEALGYMIPAKFLEAALHNLLQEETTFLANYRPMVLNKFDVINDTIRLGVENRGTAHEFTARYVFAADGTNSTVREFMSWQVTTIDNDETAIVAEITLHSDHHQIAYERFYKEGVLAILPLQDKKAAVILSTATREAKRLLQLSDELFIAEVKAIIGNRVGKVQAVSARISYPLRTVLANKAATNNVLLLGNAAHTVHPVAAQGFNLALYEVAVLVDAIETELTQHGKLQHLNCLDVEAALLKQQSMSIRVSRELTAMARKPSWLQQVGMQIGMLALEMQPFFKQYFVNAMLGRHGRMPRSMVEKVE